MIESERIVQMQRTLHNFKEANEGRNIVLYQGSMGAATFSKAESFFHLISDPRQGAFIVDVGSGTGDIAELLALVFREAHVVGLDMSNTLIKPAHANRSLVSYLRADGTLQNFKENSLDVKIFGTSGHEVESFGGKGKMREAVKASFKELRPGGILIVRDMVVPDRKAPVFVQYYDRGGVESVNDAMVDGKIDYAKLSKVALLREFQHDFKVNREGKQGPAFSYRWVEVDGQRYIEILPKWAHEFNLRKDYTTNYPNEKNEEYTYWTLKDGEDTFYDAGFVNVRAIPNQSDWLIQHNFIGKVGMFEKGRSGHMRPLSPFLTHAVWVGVKPQEKFTVPGVDVTSYKKIIDSITYDQQKQTVTIDDLTFHVDPDYHLIKGSKKMVFHLQDDPTKMLKVIRTDTLSPAAVLKAMREAIENEDVLVSHKVAHAKILQVDTNNPPRFVIQEAIAPGSVSAADLIINGELSETDVQQIAEMVNSFEQEGKYQLDTNPFNWYRVVNEDSTTQMTYVDGKVYPYEKNWDFKRIGLLQWNNPRFVSNVEVQSAHIPKVKEYEEFAQEWQDNRSQVAMWWKKYLHPDLQPAIPSTE